MKEHKSTKRRSVKLVLLLIVFFITLFIFLLFKSSLNSITAIEIKGNHFLSNSQIGQASKISVGDHYFGLSTAAAAARVKALPMAETVEISKHFPGRVTIAVKEFAEVAFQISPDGKRAAILANGTAVPLNGNVQLDKPILTGWTADNKLKVKLCDTLSKIAADRLVDISEIKPDPSPAYPDKIRMYTRSRYEVITTIAFLPSKIEYLDNFIADLKDKNITSGQLTLLEADTHTPFPKDNAVIQKETTQ